MNQPNGVNTGYSYDTASRLTGVNGIAYTLDANGNRIQMTDWEGMTTYSYDALDRLMQATYPTSTVTYTLDSVGNRLSDSMASFAYDPSDRITNSGFTYDANGNLLADGTATYEYDAANRLVRTTRNGVVTSYGYDGWGNLVQDTLTGISQPGGAHEHYLFRDVASLADIQMHCARISPDHHSIFNQAGMDSLIQSWQ